MVAGAASESHRNNSCTINTVTENQKKKKCSVDYSREKVPEITLSAKGGRKGTIPLPRFSFQTIKGTPDWPLGSTFPAVLSINAADRSVPFSKNN